jgi:hypothetical protein
MSEITDYLLRKYGVTEDVFFNALRLSPNAEGYVNGSITELLLKQRLEARGFEVHRIKEKWEGAKHANHHGDFYFKRENEPWFVLESKGVKSNSEKWHKLYNYDKLLSFLSNHNDKINWINENSPAEQQIKEWVDNELPNFQDEYSSTIYDFEEIKKYLNKYEGRDLPNTGKAEIINELRDLTREEISAQIDERLSYVMQKVKVLETHFVSGTSGANHRTQATPRIDEFNLISIDIFLRYTQQEFVFANPTDLEPSNSDNNHLQQNYIMGFVFNDNELSLSEEWHRNINLAYETLDDENAISATDMQIDNRN